MRTALAWIFGLAFVLTLAIILLNVILQEEIPAIEYVKSFSMIAGVLSIPIGAIWALSVVIRHGADAIYDAYETQQMQGMTDEERRAYQRRAPAYAVFLGNHYGPVALVGIGLLAILVPMISLPMLGAFCVMQYQKSRIVRQELRGERPAVYTGDIVGLGLSGPTRKRDRGPAA